MKEIYKAMDGSFRQDCDFMELVWDSRGRYQGQWQPDMLGDTGGSIFIGPDPAHKCFVADLTAEQMEKAAIN